MLNSIKNFIFDLDGTLVNSSEEVLMCFKKAFEQAKYPLDENLLTSDVIGPPLEDILTMLAPKLIDTNKRREIIKNYRNIYDYDANDISIMYDGLFDFLHNLKKQNKKLFIATFKPNIPTIRVLDKFHITKYFDDIYTIDKFKKNITKIEMVEDIINRYQLKKEETIMLGDAPSDMLAATKNKIKAVGVLWGYSSDKTNLKRAADLCIENIKELECLK